MLQENCGMHSYFIKESGSHDVNTGLVSEIL